MSHDLAITTYSASQNYSSHFPVRSSCKSSQLSCVTLRPEGVSKLIRSSSFRETNISKIKCYRQEPAIKALKSYSESKQAGLHFKKHIRSSKKPSIFYSKLFLEKWISSTKPLGGFEPDLNYFFLEVLKINISLAPVGIEFESNCSETPVNRPFSRGFPTT